MTGQDQHNRISNTITTGPQLVSVPAPVITPATAVIRTRRSVAVVTGVLLLAAGGILAVQTFGVEGLDQGYLAGLATMLAGVIVIVGAAVIDSNLTVAGRLDDLEASLRRLAKALAGIDETEHQVLTEMQGVGNRLMTVVEDELAGRRPDQLHR